MGIHPLISYDEYPQQSEAVGTFVDVVFGDGGTVRGLVVRDDVNYPRLNRRIVQLDDDRYLLVQTTTEESVLAVFAEEGTTPNEADNPVFFNGGYPAQGSWHMKRTEVCFRYDSSRTVMGTIVRDDSEKPYETIIALDDGRWVLTGECMHSPQS